MITQTKFRLFSNDPKFRNITLANKFAQQIAIQKVYAKQKQLHRKNVIADSISKKQNPNLGKPDTEIDFIQTRLHAFEMMIATDIEKLYLAVEQIQETYRERKAIQQSIDFKIEQIAKKIEDVESHIGQEQEKELLIVEKAVSEIQAISQQNSRLKNENAEIAARILKKKNSRKVSIMSSNYDKN